MNAPLLAALEVDPLVDKVREDLEDAVLVLELADLDSDTGLVQTDVLQHPEEVKQVPLAKLDPWVGQ